MRWYCQVVLKRQSWLDEDEENTGIRSNGPQQLVCHPAHHYEQQQLQLQQYNDTQNSSRSSGNSTTYARTIMFAFRQCVVHVPFRHESNLQQSPSPRTSVVSFTILLNQQMSYFLFMKAPPNTSLSLQTLVDPTPRRHSIPPMHGRCIYNTLYRSIFIIHQVLDVPGCGTTHGGAYDNKK